MDADRFDALAKSLAAGHTRRTTVRLLAGGVVGIVAGLGRGVRSVRGQGGGACDGIPPCPWPQVGQDCCDEPNGYACTANKVCCRPGQEPCGGAPGAWGCCCRTDAGEACNPAYDPDTPGSECCPCQAGRVRCRDGCCGPGERCDPATIACAPCPAGQPACGFFCCPSEAYECVDGVCRCPDERFCGAACCPRGNFCCDRSRGLCCPSNAECCNPDAADAVCCAAPDRCAREGFPIPPGARRVCCPPERYGGGAEGEVPEFCCADGLVAADVFTPNGLCCEPQSLCNGMCCSAPGSSFPAVCCAGDCCGPAPESQCCDDVCRNTRLDREHCGGCGNRCREDQECEEGGCRCPGGGTVCDDVCVDTRTDRTNCGGCGNSCAPGRPCCGGRCVNANADRANCGRCGRRCRRGKRCRGGRCR